MKNGSTSLQNSLFDSAQLCSRSYFAVTSWLLRSHFRSQRGAMRSLWLLRGLYAVTTVTTRSLRSLRNQKEHMFGLRKRSTSLQNGLFDRNIVAVLISLLLQNGFITAQIGFKFNSIDGFNASCLPQHLKSFEPILGSFWSRMLRGCVPDRFATFRI